MAILMREREETRGRLEKPNPLLDKVRYSAVALSLVAGLMHAWVAPEHFGEWWGYGLFFVGAALVQILYAALLVWRPQKWIVAAGVAGNLLIIGLYVFTRTVGIPFIGPGAWEVEGVDAIGLASKAAELALVVALLVLISARSRLMTTRSA